MAEQWCPSADGLAQLRDLFFQSRSATNAEHRHAQQLLVKYKSEVADFNNYLAYILSTDPDDQVRQMAGLVLKANVAEQAYWNRLQPAVQE